MRPWTAHPTSSNTPNVSLNDTSGDILIIGGVHGDEPCGWKGLTEFYRENYTNLTRPVTFLLANPHAAFAEKRYIDTDLNRQFGSEHTPDEEHHEVTLASRISNIIDEFDLVISLHATQSTDEPFALFGPPVSKQALQLLQRAGISKTVSLPREAQYGSLISYPQVLEFECGFQQSQDAINNAKRIITDAIAAIDGLETHRSTPKSDVRIFELGAQITKPEGDNLSVEVNNLCTVPENKLIAKTDSEQLHAPEPFAPILVSENGYQDILGYTGVEVGWLSDAEILQHPRDHDIITNLSFNTNSPKPPNILQD